MKFVQRHVPELAFQKIEKCYKEQPPLFKHEKEVFYFILDLFFRLKVYNKNAKYTDDGMITISSKYFKAYLSKNYSLYLRWLIKNEIIVCDKIKKTGKSYGYEIHPSVESKLISINISKDSKVTNKIIENYNKRQKYHKKLEDHILIMKKFFKKNIKINTKDAIEWIENNLKENKINVNQYCILFLSIKMIDNQEFYFNVNKVNGRLDTNITNLKSDLRKFLIGEYCHIDTKNSQPLIINFILNYIISHYNYKETPPTPLSPPSLGTEYEKILSKELSFSDLSMLKKSPLSAEMIAEFDDYKNATFKNDFYDYLRKDFSLNFNTISRQDMKELILRVFFSRNISYKKEKALFRSKYPIIYDIIFKLKRERHNKLALCLQRIESEIFINRICKKLVQEGIVPVTIHDSVIVLSSDKQKAIDIISSVYNEFLGGVPQLEVSFL